MWIIYILVLKLQFATFAISVTLRVHVEMEYHLKHILLMWRLTFQVHIWAHSGGAQI